MASHLFVNVSFKTPRNIKTDLIKNYHIKRQMNQIIRHDSEGQHRVALIILLIITRGYKI